MWKKGWQPTEVTNSRPPEYRRAVSPPPPLKLQSGNNYLKMLYVFDIEPKQVYIYDISYDSTGYPLFLTYINGQWIRKSAKYFIPIGEEL